MPVSLAAILYSVFRANTARAGIHLGLKMSFEEALAINVAAQERGELFPLSYIDDYGIPLPDCIVATTTP